MWLKITMLLSVMVAATAVDTITLPFSDDFSQQTQAGRTFANGTWQVENNQARCIFDEAIFAKVRHGPVMKYKVAFTDGALAWSWRANAEVKNYIIFIDGPNGHLVSLFLKPQSGILALQVGEK